MSTRSVGGAFPSGSGDSKGHARKGPESKKREGDRKIGIDRVSRPSVEILQLLPRDQTLQINSFLEQVGASPEYLVTVLLDLGMKGLIRGSSEKWFTQILF